MNTTHTLVVAGALSALLLSSATPAAAAPRPLIIRDVSGAVRIQQDLPCRQTVDLTTSITQGRMDLTWLQTSRTEVLLDLMRMTMFLSPFHVDAKCDGLSGAVSFREIGLQLAGAVRVTATETGGRESGVFRFRIPTGKFLVYESVIDDAKVRQPERRYKLPREDVTGLIDLRRGTVQLRVVLAQELHFRAGCEGARCRIDETHTGTSTSEIRGGSFSRTPPTVLCAPERRLGNGFTVSASDASEIKLGTFTLANNEVIQLLLTNEPGVRLVPSQRGDTIRQFQAGPEHAFILATDKTNQSAIAYCR
jgi:hypothetical protein